MADKIKVVITTHTVPFDQIVEGIFEFDDATKAVEFINKTSAKWWKENDGDRAVKQGNAEEYQPITELGYDSAQWELWDGEMLFHAMIDKISYWRLHNEHYKREFDDKGIERPGYLRVAYGEDVSNELAELYAFYAPKH